MQIHAHTHSHTHTHTHSHTRIFSVSLSHTHTFLDGYCSTVQGLLDWFEADLGFTELWFIQIDLCVLCVFVLNAKEPYKRDNILQKRPVFSRSLLTLSKCKRAL